MRLVAVLAFGIFLVPGFNARTQAQVHDVKSETRVLLDAYAHQDAKTVLAVISDQTVMYGADSSEIFRGVAQIQTMISNDARLWSGTAHIGDMQNVTVVSHGNLESIFFQAPFTVGNRPPVPVRFCMLWKHSGKHWLLLQSSNAVVTEHQSAAELLGAH
ncbi:MAG: nuclear transport factor 2 family protein [Edaphobacter sp.]